MGIVQKISPLFHFFAMKYLLLLPLLLAAPLGQAQSDAVAYAAPTEEAPAQTTPQPKSAREIRKARRAKFEGVRTATVEARYPMNGGN